MTSKKISEATDISAVVATDVIPIERPGNTTAYKASIAELFKSIVRIVLSSLKSIIQIDSNVTNVPWEITSYRATFDGTPNEVLNIGINNGLNAAQDGVNAGAAIQIELCYDWGANIDTEFIEAWLSPNGLTARRSRQANITHNEDATHEVGSCLTFQNGAHIFYNSAGNTHIMDIHDVGGKATMDGETIHYYDNKWASGTGPILIDRADGHTYRLKVTNGVLGTEQVT